MAKHISVCSSKWEVLFLGLLKQMRLMPTARQLEAWKKGMRAWKVNWGGGEAQRTRACLPPGRENGVRTLL